MSRISAKNPPQFLYHIRVDVAEMLVVGQCTKQIKFYLLFDWLKNVGVGKSAISVREMRL